MNWRFWQQRPAPAPTPVRVEPTVRPALRIAQDVLAASRRSSPGSGPVDGAPWTIPTPPPGVVPKGSPTMAMDHGIVDVLGWAGDYSGFGGIGGPGEGIGFLGYPYLAQLTQRPEYRRGAEIIAKEMTREWIELIGTGEGDKAAKLAAIDEEMKRLNVRDIFRRVAELDGFFGKGQLYLDTGATDKPNELITPLALNKAKLAKGGLLRLVIIEPVWSYPADYNTVSPLDPDFYKPRAWYVMGNKIDKSRLLTFVGREMPDMLKPSYLFGGLSLSQMAKPYVDNWIRTRTSVSDITHKYSTNVLATNLGAELSGAIGSAGGINDRVQLFNNYADNTGTMVIDKDTEEFINVSAPLGTLDHLQAQAQEQMSAVYGIPLVVFFGITPSGLNTSTDGEMEAWHKWIGGQQEHLFNANMYALLGLIQLSLFGDIDPEIDFIWKPLGKSDAVAEAAVRKSDGDLAVSLIGAGVLWPEEERKRLAEAEDSIYPGLDVSDLPELPEPVDSTDDPGAEGETDSKGA